MNLAPGRIALVAVLAAASTLTATVVSALSIAPEEPWAPSAITAQGELHYTGNSLILDATSGEATFNSTEFPFNRSVADLRLTKQEANSVLAAYLVWGVAVPMNQSADGKFTSLHIEVPGDHEMHVRSLDSFSVDNGELTHTYFIADVSHAPVATGVYRASLPDLALNDVTVRAAGWSLFVITANTDAEVKTFTPLWPLSLESNAKQVSGGLFSLLPENSEEATITLPSGQSRQPDSGFTAINDVILGQDETAGTTITRLENAPVSLSSGFGVSVIPQTAGVLTGRIRLLDPATRTAIDQVRSGQRITVQVEVENASTADIYNARVALTLPSYLQYKKGSLFVPAGTINSGIHTDRSGDDMASFDRSTRTIVWQPGDTSVSNTSRPHLVKREDSSQYLEFEAYVGDYPISTALRLAATVDGSLSSTRQTPSVVLGTVSAPLVTGYSSSPKTDLAVDATLSPLSSTYWALDVQIANQSTLRSPYEWRVQLPEYVVNIELPMSDVHCELAQDTTNRVLVCESLNDVSPQTRVIDRVVLRLNTIPESSQWSEVQVKPDRTSVEDLNMLDNSAAVTIQDSAFKQAPQANDDTFTSSTSASYLSTDSILTNDNYLGTRVMIQIVQQPAHGSVRVDKLTGSFSYEQVTRALIPSDTFSYRLVDVASGTTSQPAKVTIIFPLRSEDEKM